MADMYAVSGETLTGIANAIRSKTGSDEMMTISAMASAIEGISGNDVESGEFSISKTGTQTIAFNTKKRIIIALRSPIFSDYPEGQRGWITTAIAVLKPTDYFTSLLYESGQCNMSSTTFLETADETIVSFSYQAAIGHWKWYAFNDQ